MAFHIILLKIKITFAFQQIAINKYYADDLIIRNSDAF